MTNPHGIAQTLLTRLSAVRAVATTLLRAVRGTSAGHGTRVDAHALRPGLAVVGIEDGQSPRGGGCDGGRVGKLGEALAGHLSPVGRLAALDAGGVDGTISGVEGRGTLVLAPGVRPGGLVIGIPKVGAAGVGGAHRGRVGKLGDADAGHLSSVGGLAAGELGAVVGTIADVVVGEGEGVLAARHGPGGVVVGVPEVGLEGGGGGGRGWWAGQLREAFATHLSSISSLTTSQHGRIRRPATRHGSGIDTNPLRPRPIVVGIIHRQSSARRGRDGRRIGQLAHAISRNLSRVRALAACQFRRKGGRVAIDREAAVALGPAGGVDGMPCRGGGGGAPAVGGEIALVLIGGAIDYNSGVGVGLRSSSSGGITAGDLGDEIAKAKGFRRGDERGEEGDGRYLHLSWLHLLFKLFVLFVHRVDGEFLLGVCDNNYIE
mmetsp:Transcript_31720/g.54086  ORF Transcript_31720/g.54086 Transcript_31720/m.54086 type:complete len:432 (-) Transcript_31720:181-1476(-)